MAQVVVCLPNKCEVLRSNPSSTKKYYINDILLCLCNIYAYIAYIYIFVYYTDTYFKTARINSKILLVNTYLAYHIFFLNDHIFFINHQYPPHKAYISSHILLTNG
jgi:hypothetical protein